MTWTPEHRWIGSIEVVVLSDGVLHIGPERLFKGVPTEITAPLLQGANERGEVPVPMRSLLVRSQGQLILIDTGLGEAPSASRNTPGTLLSQLAQVGVQPEQIDHVIFSHAHGDHIGWNTRLSNGERRLTFVNARHWLAQAEWDHFTQPSLLEASPAVRNNLPPLLALGNLEIYDGEIDVTPQIRILPTPGHTPGHCSIAITASGESAIYTGDISHHPLHYEHPEWVSVFDVLPDHAYRTRMAFLQKAVEEGTLLISYHHPTPFGRAAANGAAFRWQPA